MNIHTLKKATKISTANKIKQVTGENKEVRQQGRPTCMLMWEPLVQYINPLHTGIIKANKLKERRLTTTSRGDLVFDDPSKRTPFHCTQHEGFTTLSHRR